MVVADLENGLHELRVAVAQEPSMSSASRRRVEVAIVEAEELLLDVRTALLLLAFGGAADPLACREMAISRAREMLAGWRVALEAAEPRKAQLEIDLLKRLWPLLTDSLEKIALSLQDAGPRSEAELRRREEARQLLDRPNLPVM